MLAALAAPAIRARLGRLPWVEGCETLAGVVRRWPEAAPASPSLLRALGAVTEEEATILRRVGGAIDRLLAAAGGRRLTDPMVQGSDEMREALAEGSSLEGLRDVLGHIHRPPV